MKIYMIVTQDKFSLPLDFDTSPTQLAKRNGVGVHNLMLNAWRYKNGKLKGYPRCVCVEVSE